MRLAMRNVMLQKIHKQANASQAQDGERKPQLPPAQNRCATEKERMSTNLDLPSPCREWYIERKRLQTTSLRAEQCAAVCPGQDRISFVNLEIDEEPKP